MLKVLSFLLGTTAGSSVDGAPLMNLLNTFAWYASSVTAAAQSVFTGGGTGTGTED